jgi:AcrR family transcriptional regulator
MTALCAGRGYAEATVREAVERVGATEESFAELFGDKEGCVKEAIDAILAETLATASRSYSADLSERDSYLLGIMAILELFASQPAFSYISFISARQMGPRRLTDGLEAGSRMLSAMLERLAGEGEGATPPPTAARAALGGAEAVVRRELAGGRAGELPELLPDFAYVATVPFLGQREALRLARRCEKLLARGAEDPAEEDPSPGPCNCG